MVMDGAILLDGERDQYYHSSPPSHCKVKPQFSFLKFIKSNTGAQPEDGESDGHPDSRDGEDPTPPTSNHGSSPGNHCNQPPSSNNKDNHGDGGGDEPNKNTNNKKLLSFVTVG